MALKVTRYKSSDGKLFETEDAAMQHEQIEELVHRYALNSKHAKVLTDLFIRMFEEGYAIAAPPRPTVKS